MLATLPGSITRGVTTVQERVERERAISDRLFGWLDGRALTLDGMAGKIRYEWRITHDPLCWIATDHDLVISLTWSERLDGICRSFGARWCKDCRRYCHHTELACPCCERLETPDPEPTCLYCDQPIAPGFASLCAQHLAMCIPCMNHHARDEAQHVDCVHVDCYCLGCHA